MGFIVEDVRVRFEKRGDVSISIPKFYIVNNIKRGEY